MTIIDDPRVKNSSFSDPCDIFSIFSEYKDWYVKGLDSVDKDAFHKAIGILESVAIEGKRVFIVGNGGSAGIADHLSADLSKGTYFERHPRIRVIPLASSMSLYTASANDFGFDDVFVHQLKIHSDPDDLLIAISSSGNSSNISNAVRFAASNGLRSVTLSGFDGGELSSLGEVNLHCNVDNYAVVEDIHQSLLQMMALIVIQRRAYS